MARLAPALLSGEHALYDELTGLPNRLLQRAQLVHALKRASRTGSQVALLFLDVDDFRDINDRHGRELGDRVLILLAARLEACLRGTDLTTRLDGDQFVILCEDLANEQDLQFVTQRIRDAVAAPLRVGDVEVELRVSIGTAISTGVDHPGDLLVAADEDLMQAKRTARARGLSSPDQPVV